MKRRVSAGYDHVSAEARSRVDAWAERSRALFTELLEDATTDLQRELLNRAVVAGHTAAEVHAFADALRGFSDTEAFDRCTIERDVAPDYTMVQLLKAEADPLFAFKLKGGELSPAEERPEPRPSVAPARSAADDPASLRPNALAAKFDTRDLGAPRRSAPQGSRDLGASADAPPVPISRSRSRPPSGGNAAVAAAPSGPVLVQDLLNEAVHALGVTYREQAVDGPGQAKLEDVMPQASAALLRGLLVPVALGPAPGQDRRLALFLQAQVSGKSRAYQLFDVLSQEIAWVNEGDLLARTELPFASKHNRRITRIALPLSKGF